MNLFNLKNAVLAASLVFGTGAVTANDLSKTFPSPYTFVDSQFRVSTFNDSDSSIYLTVVEVAGNKDLNYSATLVYNNGLFTLDLSDPYVFYVHSDIERDSDYTSAVFYPSTGILTIPYVILDNKDALEVNLRIYSIEGNIVSFMVIDSKETERFCERMHPHTSEYYQSGCGYLPTESRKH